MTLRKIIFWLHLVAGIIAGAVVLVMSVTGVLLAFERQMVEWADRDLRVAPAGYRHASVVHRRDHRRRAHC